MSLSFKVGILVFLVLAIILFNRATYKPLVEGHGGGGGGGGRGGGGGIGRGGGGIGRGGGGIGRGGGGHGGGFRRGLGYGALGYGAYRGFYGSGGNSGYYGNGEDDYGYVYDYYPEVTYDMYGNPVLLRPYYYA